jgi:hypothetical protein
VADAAAVMWRLIATITPVLLALFWWPLSGGAALMKHL